MNRIPLLSAVLLGALSTVATLIGVGSVSWGYFAQSSVFPDPLPLVASAIFLFLVRYRSARQEMVQQEARVSVESTPRR